MAILATRRKWEVTSLCAASRSPCSRQLLASMYSCCGSSIGNRRISSRYRDRPDSAVRIGSAAARAILAPSILLPPMIGGRLAPDASEPSAPMLCNREMRSHSNIQDKGVGQKTTRRHVAVTPLESCQVFDRNRFSQSAHWDLCTEATF